MFLLNVCHALNEAKVRYGVVGGYAVALHGAVRGTVDLDLVLSLGEKNFVSAEKVFRALGLESRLPLDARQVIRFREEYIRNRNLTAWSFYDPVSPKNQLDIVLTEDLNEMETQVIRIRGVKVRIASIPSLIRMKIRSGRPQDVEDVRALKELLKNEK